MLLVMNEVISFKERFLSARSIFTEIHISLDFRAGFRAGFHAGFLRFGVLIVIDATSMCLLDVKAQITP
jgi:hypothetical protein